MSGWSSVTIGEVSELKAGFAFKSKSYVDKGIRLLRGDNIAQGKLRWVNSKCWPVELANLSDDYILREGDVVLAMDRPWINAGLKWSWIHRSDLPALLVQRVARLRAKPQLDQTFLRYIIGSPAFTDHVLTILTGVNVPHISGRDIQAHQFSLPPLPIQKRIAGILSAYDDLIAVNERRIAILEEMARRVFEEWFGVNIVVSASENWNQRNTISFTEIAEVLSGGTPKKSEPEFWSGDIPFFTPRDAPGSCYVQKTHSQITASGLAKCNSKLYPKDTIFITARGTVGKLGLASTDMAMNQSCYALRAKNGYGQLFLYNLTLSAVLELKSRSQGAVFDTIVVETFEKLLTRPPSVEKAAEFEHAVEPLYKKALTVLATNTNLRATRDLLLPRLISGEIEVSETPLPKTVAEE